MAHFTTTGSDTYPAGVTIQTVSNRPSNYASTTAYHSGSLVPAAAKTITAKQTNSHFLINWNAQYGRSASGRSQFLMADSYSAGTSNYSAGNYLFYDHYGWYYDSTGGKGMTSYSYYDNSQSISAAGSITYYVFLGTVSAGTDYAGNQEIMVSEIAA